MKNISISLLKLEIELLSNRVVHRNSKMGTLKKSWRVLQGYKIVAGLFDICVELNLLLFYVTCDDIAVIYVTAQMCRRTEEEVEAVPTVGLSMA